MTLVIAAVFVRKFLFFYVLGETFIVTVVVLTSAAVFLGLGAFSLYLASPNQRLLSRALPKRLMAFMGMGFLLISLILLWTYSGPATSVFILLTGAMLVWTVFPAAIAYVRHRSSFMVDNKTRSSQ